MSSSPKNVRLILVVAFMFSVLTHGALVMFLPPQAATASPEFLENARSICYTLAAAGLLTSLYWTFVKLPSAPDPTRLTTETILALALTEICSIAGLVLFFIGHKPAGYWPFGAAALLVQGLFILPRAMQRD